ncbi:MAG: hypothetical protein V9G18_22255 [Albidovulum sp.]
MTPPPIDRLISLVLTARVVARVVARFAWRFGHEAGLVALAGCGFSLGLIWFGAWWATYVLPFGWWGRPKPSDLDNPAYAVVLPIFGRVFLLVLAALVR